MGKQRSFTTMSLFCGCGGEYTGKINALRRLIPMDKCKLLALNHNPIAVGTLSHNFLNKFRVMPFAYCEGIEVSSAQSYGISHLDMLWASPSCTHHSNARGGKPRDEQERAHAYEVIERWLDPKQSGCTVDVFLMENVKEFMNWGPLLKRDYVEVRRVRRRNGKIENVKRVYKKGTADPRRKGEFFRDFINKLRALGYLVEWKILCSADFGDPTTRERFFLQAVKDGMGIHWPAPTHQKRGTEGNLPIWRSARDHVVDWTIKGMSIYYRERFRKKALVPNTIKRIVHGLKKYGLRAYFDYQKNKSLGFSDAEAFMMIYHGGADCERRVKDMDEPVSTLDCGNRVYVVEPFIGKGFAGNYNGPGQSVDEPLPTVTAVDHNQLFEPHLIQQYGWQTQRGEGGVTLDNPMPTLATSQHHPIIDASMIIQRGASTSRDIDEPAPTLSTELHEGVMQPTLITYHTAEVERGEGARSLDDPHPTILAGGNHSAVLDSFCIDIDHSKASPNSRSADDPLNTVVTKQKNALIDAFVFKANHTHSGARRVEDIDNPLSTETTKLEHGVVDSFFVQYYGCSKAADMDKPLPTVTVDDRFGVIESFLVENYHDRVDKGTGSLSLDEPFPTCVTHPKHSLADARLVARVRQSHDKEIADLLQLIEEREGGVENLPIIRTESDLDQHDFTKPFRIEIGEMAFLVDVTLRMLEPHELAKAMGFPADFEFKMLSDEMPKKSKSKKNATRKPKRRTVDLNKKEAIKMIGNAVSVGLAEELVYAVEAPRINAKKGKSKKGA